MPVFIGDPQVFIVDPQIFIWNRKLSTRFKPQIFIGDQPKIFKRDPRLKIEDPRLFFGDPKLFIKDPKLFPRDPHRFLLETPSFSFFSFQTQDF